MAAEQITTTRRDVLACAALLPAGIIIGGPAMGRSVISDSFPSTAFRTAERQYRAAEARFNNLPSNMERATPAAYRREEEAFHRSIEAVDCAPVKDWTEFADAYEIACDNGASLPNEDLIMKLLEDTRRLRRIA